MQRSCMEAKRAFENLRLHIRIHASDKALCLYDRPRPHGKSCTREIVRSSRNPSSGSVEDTLCDDHSGSIENALHRATA